MFEIKEISVAYDGRTILDRIGMGLEQGTFTALVGPNGTGKSTLLKSIAGLIPAKGQAALAGRVLNQNEKLKTVAYMPQDTGAQSSLTVLEVVLLGRLQSLGMRIGDDIREQAIAALGRFHLEALQDRPIGAISGGQRQLVFLAQSLFRAPKVLLLDEPTAALDLRHQLIVLDRIRATCADSGMIAMAAMHDLSLAARFADRIVFLNGGMICADGAPDKVLNPEILQQVYGVEAEVQQGQRGVLHVSPVRALQGIWA
ncbi:MAG TPA: ABC transporter ATP-binding protein [Rhodobacteraceae bacterium]|nr:ABC transporter ATP-binding protein [Paracoccaceae bacterium]